MGCGSSQQAASKDRPAKAEPAAAPAEEKTAEVEPAKEPEAGYAPEAKEAEAAPVAPSEEAAPEAKPETTEEEEEEEAPMVMCVSDAEPTHLPPTQPDPSEVTVDLPEDALEEVKCVRVMMKAGKGWHACGSW